MMKKLWILVLPLFLTLTSFAQEGGRMSFDQYPNFEGDTLLILIGKNAEYDKAIEQTIKSNWKITPYKFVNEKQLYKLANSDSYSMLVLDQSTKTRGRSVIKRKHFSLFPCGRTADLTNYGGKYAVSQFSLSDIDKPQSYIGKLPFLVQSMQAYISYLDSAKNMDEDTFKPMLMAWKNAQRGELKNRTLIIPASDLPKGISEAKLKQSYGYPLKVVKNSELEKYLSMTEGPKALYHLDARKRYISVISDSGQLLYYGEANSPGEFSVKDVKTIAKAVDKPYNAGNSLESRINRFNSKVNKSLNSKPKK